VKTISDETSEKKEQFIVIDTVLGGLIELAWVEIEGLL
jgi:hypothetical protein